MAPVGPSGPQWAPVGPGGPRGAATGGRPLKAPATFAPVFLQADPDLHCRGPNVPDQERLRRQQIHVVINNDFKLFTLDLLAGLMFGERRDSSGATNVMTLISTEGLQLCRHE